MSFTSEHLHKVQIFKGMKEVMQPVKIKIFAYNSSFCSIGDREQNEYFTYLHLLKNVY